ncbi:MAG: hypothetical protein PHW82_00715 [Bacteroidales bacterium]|nr:hypothetical protein [Bacteroidales bacterium]
MKAIKFQFVFLIIIVGSVTINAQNYHLVYKTDIYSVDLKQAAEGDKTSSYSTEKGYQHILSFKDKKALNFQQAKTDTSISTIGDNFNAHKNYLIIDRKKNKFQWVMAFYNKKAEKVYINGYDKKAWCKNDPLSKPVLYKNEKDFIETYKFNDIFPEWEAPEITYTEETKEINAYSCKNVTVVNGQQTYNVWYTEEINYNWCFNDYRVLIPGTVVLIEHKGKVRFELLQIEILDFEKLPVRKEIIEELLKLV